jgi:hypothetical protein
MRLAINNLNDEHTKIKSDFNKLQINKSNKNNKKDKNNEKDM